MKYEYRLISYTEDKIDPFNCDDFLKAINLEGENGWFVAGILREGTILMCRATEHGRKNVK